jgi:hypothetical protein
MEVESPKETGGKKLWPLILASVLIFLVLYYSIMAVISTSRKVSAINKEFGFKQPENTAIDNRVFSDSAYVKLIRKKAFYQSRNLMAETDSISLALNLADSSAIIEINGVAVHIARLTYLKISSVLYRADEYAVSSMLSVPFTVTENHSTIAKEPLMLKVAPKDTSEYKPNILPDTTNTAPVNFMMEMDNGFRLYVYQETGDDAGGAMNRFVFDTKDRFKNIWTIIKNIAMLKVPEYHPSIRLRMKKTDARIIYRALPVHGQIAVYR